MTVLQEIQRAGVHEKIYSRIGHFGDAVYAFTLALVMFFILGVIGWGLGLPLLIASLGPTLFLAVEKPLSQASTVRNQVVGHSVGALIGWGMLAAFGFLGEGTVLEEGLTFLRVVEASVALAFTFGALLLLKAQHPPAAATVLIVSLGFMQTTVQVLTILFAALVLAALTWMMNRALGVPMGLWSAGRAKEEQKEKATKRMTEQTRHPERQHVDGEQQRPRPPAQPA